MVIDVHAHFWTDAYLDKMAALGKTDTAAQRGRGAGDGTDFPYETGAVFERAVSYITTSGLAPGEADRVLSANAQTLFGRPDP